MARSGLKHLPTLGRLVANRNLDLPEQARKLVKSVRDPLPILVPPFNSAWEVWLNSFLLKQNPYWQAQVQFGQLGKEGATRPDWLNQMLGIALYLDTPVHHFRHLESKDAYVRASLRPQYRVVVWDVPDFEYMKRNAAEWYRRVILGV